MCNTVEPPNKGYFGNRPVVLCSEVVLCLEVVQLPMSEVHQKVIIIFLYPKIFRYYRQYNNYKHVVLTIEV